jgi:hypothetical protein
LGASGALKAVVVTAVNDVNHDYAKEAHFFAKRVANEEKHHPNSYGPRLEQDCLTEEYEHHPADHRVSNMAVGASDDQPLRGIPRSGRSLPEFQKKGGCPHTQCEAAACR